MDEGFAIAALPTTHLFQWLPRFPDGDSREMPHEVEGEDGLQRYTWTIDSEDPDGDFCGVMMLDLDPERLIPIRSLSANCPEGAPGTGFRTDYEVVEFVPPDSLPEWFFESSEVGIDPTPPVETSNADPAANGGRAVRSAPAQSLMARRVEVFATPSHRAAIATIGACHLRFATRGASAVTLLADEAATPS